MTKIITMSLLFLCIMATYSSAQMGHGMMRGHGSGQGMMEHMMHEGMMNRGNMEDRVSEMIIRLSEIMGDLSGRIKSISAEKRHDLTNVIKDISREMNAVSEMTERGSATDDEIEAMRERLAEIRKKVSAIN